MTRFRVPRQVTAGSPAARAGLRTGDVAVAMDGRPLDGGPRQLLAACKAVGSVHTLCVPGGGGGRGALWMTL